MNTCAKIIVTGLLSLVVGFVAFTPGAIAVDLIHGAKVFANNCAACHINGGNVVSAAKTLKKDALETYNMASLEAIMTQVTNGKAAMPAFRGRLSEQQIEDVAAYVLEQAEKGW